MVQLVGILNLTPDSFSDGGKFIDFENSIRQAEMLFESGASIVDVGAESTRPKAEVIDIDEEWNRLDKVLQYLLAKYPGQVSLDSRNVHTIERAYKIGPVIINDVTGFTDPEMMKLAVSLNSRVIISHFPAGYSIQQAHEEMPVKTVLQVKQDLLKKAEELQQMGLSKENIILDPGIGFGKTPELNAELLKFADLVPDYPVMIGYSRKRFLGENRMEIEPNLEAGRIAIEHGAEYLRVHDVLGHIGIINQKP